jgi:hypothetical protein
VQTLENRTNSTKGNFGIGHIMRLEIIIQFNVNSIFVKLLSNIDFSEEFT